MPRRSWLEEVPFPIDHARQLSQASVAVRQIRLQHPEQLFHWEPERGDDERARPRRELALALALVQAMDAGDGGYEARVRACQRLYKLGARASAEGLRAAELLLRSRMVAGATDVETFWLAATLAHPARAMVSPQVAQLAWRYLVAAPFNLDALSAAEFCRDSRAHRYGDRPRWPYELTTALMEQPEQRELCVILLEGMAATHLRAPTIELAAAKLPAGSRALTPLFQDVILRLAHQYIDGELDTTYAREVARQAADLGDERARRFLETRIFDAPYDELAGLVKAWLKGDTEELDAYYRRALEAGQLQVARRLAEIELVLRYGAWKKGPIYPSVEAVIQEILGREEALDDPRLEELMLRAGLLYSRTHHYTPAARMLVQHLTADPDRMDGDGPVGAMREELQGFIRACDPYQTLHEATRAMEARLEELEGGAREALEESRAWMAGRFKLAGASLARSAEAVAAPFTGRRELADALPVAAMVERTLSALHTLGPRLIDLAATRREIATQAGVSYERLREADPRRLKAVAAAFGRGDRLVAAGGGALSGLLGGPWGAAADLLSLLGISARAVGRIGMCFDIVPGSPAALELLAGSLMVGSSSQAGEGLVTLLREEQRAARTTGAAAGVLALGGTSARVAPRSVARLITLVARQLGFSLSERQILKVVPLLGAVLASGADYLFLRAVTDAAVHLGARRFLMAPPAAGGGPSAPRVDSPCW